MLKRIKIQLASILCVLPVWAVAGMPSGASTLLRADFDDKTIGQPIGSGGAALGEPSQIVGPGTEIIDCTPIRLPSGGVEKCLRATNDLSTTAARSIRWQFLGNEEITTGVVSMSFDFVPSALDRYTLAVRESGGSANSFLSLELTSSGAFTASDASGPITLNSLSYSANQLLKIRFEFDMDAGTSQASVNNTVLFTGRAHGVVGRGVGRLNTGFGSSGSGNPFQLNSLLVKTTRALPIILDATFNNQTVGQPLPAGGAVANQPISIAAAITTQITAAGAGNRALTMSVASAPIAAPAVRWQFLDNIEVLPGTVAIETDVQFASLNAYFFLVTETSTSNAGYGGLFFAQTGQIAVIDASGSGFIPGASYQAGVRYRLRLTYDQFEGTYSALLNDNVLFEDRAHGVNTGRGIGAFLVGFGSNGSAGSAMTIDDLQVGASAAPGIVSELAVLQQPTTGVVGQALAPTLEIGALNVFDDVVTDGATVTIDVASGPAGATLSQNAVTTVAGMARFPSLSTSAAGVYRLRASADRTQITTSMPLTVAPRASSVFSNGFESQPN